MQIAVTPDQYATYHPEGIAAREAAEAAEYTFLDLVDVVNPLQHLPLVNMVYREVTGDTIKGPAMILGGFLYGGPAGLGAGMINAVSQEVTGGTITDHVLDGVFGGERVRGVSRQDLYAVFGDPEAAPGTEDLLATTHRAPTREELHARTAEIAAIARGLSGTEGGSAMPTYAELDARTAQVAAVARHLAMDGGTGAAPDATTMTAAGTVVPPSVPAPPGRPDRRPETGQPAAAQIVMTPAPTATPTQPDTPEVAESRPPMPALGLTLPDLAGTAVAGQLAGVAPTAGTPPPPEAFMALQPRVPTTTSRMTLAASTGVRPTPSAPPTSSWMAQEIAATAAAPSTDGLASGGADADEPAPDTSADPMRTDAGESHPIASGALPTQAIPTTMMRNLDAYQTMAQTAVRSAG